MSKSHVIKAIDGASVHRITSGQVVIDLQTSVKELLENSIDAGAINVDIRFKNYGLNSIEVIDDGSGIAEEDYDSVALKHHTSKLETFSDLTRVRSFGFRGEALSSLCALCEELTVSTATSTTAPRGVALVMDSRGRVKGKTTVARTRGTTITLNKLFTSLPVRRKEFERNAKREFGKALSLLNAYALVPCATSPGIRLTVSNQSEKGTKTVQIRTLGSPSCGASVTALWGPKALENIVEMNLEFEVEKERTMLKRLQNQDLEPISVRVKGLISKFTIGCGRVGTDRQFFYVNGRPCNMSKIQKAFNEVYRSFNTNQAPFILADFLIPTESYDVNVSPDKRTLLIHSEDNLISGLKAALESRFSPSRATYDLGGGTGKTQTLIPQHNAPAANKAKGGKDRPPKDGPSSGLEIRQLPIQPPNIQERVQFSDTPSPLPTSDNLNAVASSSTREPTTSSSPRPLFLPADDDENDNDNDNVVIAPSSTSQYQAEPETDDFMDVDHDELEPASAKDTIISADPSQTAWGRKLGMMTTRSRPPTFSPDPVGDVGSVITLPSPGGDEINESDTVHARKKRKSDIGAIITVTSEDDAGTAADNVGDRVDDTPHTAVNKAKTPAKKSGSRKASQNLRLNLRSQLAGFARTGSQLPLPSQALRPAPHEESEEDELDEEKDGTEEDELDCEDNGQKGCDQQDMDVAPVHVAGPPVVTFADLDESATIDNPIDLTVEDDEPSSELSQACASSSTSVSVRPEVIQSDKDGHDITLKMDVVKIEKVWARKPLTRHPRIREDVSHGIPVDAGISNTESDMKAADALARIIEKRDFEKMDVVGQFNLGFIVVRRQKDDLDDLFVVDQHAADEKYNFETLQATTKIQSQKLFRPRALELTASDEMLAMENMEILRNNGFEINVDEDSPVGQGSRLKLAAQPISKDTVFDMKDLEEIIHLMRDRPTGQMVRCSKARAMFASRACRKSVMVGMSLTPHQMTTVIRHMGTMDQPWNCPHGRPTMRHLVDIRSSGSRAQKDTNWSSIC